MYFIISNILLLLFILLSYEFSEFHSNFRVETIARILLTVSLISASSFLVKYRKKRIFCFELLFFITFIFATFPYPAFLYQNIPHPMFRNLQDSTVIKALFLATAGLLSYIIGASIGHPWARLPLNQALNVNRNYNFTQFARVINLVSSFFILMFFLQGGYVMIYTYSDGFTNSLTLAILFQFARIFVFISTVAEFARLNTLSVKTSDKFFRTINLHYLINILVFTLFLLISGDRGIFLELFLPIVLLFQELIKRINFRIIGGLAIGLFIVLVIIKDIRSEHGGVLSLDARNMTFNLELVNCIEDFLPASATLYILVDYSDFVGHSFGKQMLPKILGMIPFAQSTISYLLDIDFLSSDYASTPVIATQQVYEDSRSGLGTHLIADVYYSWGWAGVIAVSCIFGLIVAHIDKHIYFVKKLRFGYLFLFVYLFCISIYIVRAEIGYPLQTLGFSLIVIWIMSKIVPFNHQKNDYSQQSSECSK